MSVYFFRLRLLWLLLLLAVLVLLWSFVCFVVVAIAGGCGEYGVVVGRFALIG